MKLQPTNIDQLTKALLSANERGEKISAVDLSAFNRVLEHKAEDMTATVEAGMTVAALQNELKKRGQWLPIDPPGADKLTVRELLENNVSGPQRFGYGTIRDHLIGITIVLADGRIVHSGGKVVKNVAGYDVAKLFIGSGGSLGIAVEATFKLRPLPESEKLVQARCASLEQADKLIEAVLSAEITPVILDCSGEMKAQQIQLGTVTLGFGGTKEEVEWQVCRAGELGFTEAGSMDYEKKFWSGAGVVQRLSVLPSRLVETLREIEGAFVGRAGNGVIYYRGPAVKRQPEATVKLMQRVKEEFDPKNILADLPL